MASATATAKAEIEDVRPRRRFRFGGSRLGGFILALNLLSLLILPLYIPVLIFATSAIDAAGMSLPYGGQLAILAAMLVGALTLTPLAVSAALRVSLN